MKLSATVKEAVADAEIEFRKKKPPKRVLALREVSRGSAQHVKPWAGFAQ